MLVQKVHLQNELFTIATVEHGAGVHVDPEVEVAGSFSINLVEHGEFVVRGRPGRSRLHAGCAFLTNPGEEFSVRHSCSEPDDVCLSITFTRRFWQHAPVDDFRKPMASPSYRLAYLRRRVCDGVATQDALALELLLYEMVDHVERGAARERFQPNLSRLYCEEVNWVIDRITSSLEEELSVHRLANAVGLSTFHFSRVFRDITGKTIHQCVLEARLRRAAEELLAGGSATEACFHSGFNNRSHFTRTFHGTFGRLPSEFRKHFRGKDGQGKKLAASITPR